MLKKHPGLFSPADLSSPHPPVVSPAEEDEDENESVEGGNRILDPDVSPLRRAAPTASTSTSAADDGSSKTKGDEERSASSKEA